MRRGLSYPEDNMVENTRNNNDIYAGSIPKVYNKHMEGAYSPHQYNNPAFMTGQHNTSDVNLEFVEGHAKYYHGANDDNVFVDDYHEHSQPNHFQSDPLPHSPHQYSNSHSPPSQYPSPYYPGQDTSGQSQPYHSYTPTHGAHGSHYGEHSQSYHQQDYQSKQGQLDEHPAYLHSPQLTPQNGQHASQRGTPQQGPLHVTQGNQSPHRHLQGGLASPATEGTEIKQKVPAKEGFRRAFSVRARRHMRRVVEYISK